MRDLLDFMTPPNLLSKIALFMAMIGATLRFVYSSFYWINIDLNRDNLIDGTLLLITMLGLFIYLYNILRVNLFSK
ncbi:hypothetical protein AHA02nite_29780 [Alkalibacillus haloalkaliphilus]|uniref:Uncharacterized protein n=1 Tax=Alkalibacillus haloalkaliphilus TaxID=94136 RepID=A0A511WD73_9BACI|nr:hypothetical protein AHA02nite_29780 [Alkalibacillus haloalkaliphilus]